MTTTDTQTLAAMQAEHAAEAARLAEQIEARERAACQARKARLLDHDRLAVDVYQAEDDQLRKAEADAKAAWRAAVLEDPMISAWIRYRACRWARTYRADAQGAAMQRTGSPMRPPPQLNYADPRLLEDVLALAEQAARAMAQDDADARHEAREAAGDGAS